MPKYDYVALDARGKETKGTIEVASQNEAIGRVKEMGLYPTKIVEAEKVQQQAGGEKGQACREGRGQKGRRHERESQHQDSRPVRPGEAEGVDDVHAPTGDACGRRPAAAARVARAGKTGTQCRRSRGYSASLRFPSRAGARFPRRWRSIPRSSTGCSSTWSRRANWAACWKSCSNAWPNFQKRRRRSRARSRPRSSIRSRC